MVTVKLGRKWDLTDCETLSAEQNSFNITSWPRGDHNVADDYSVDECTEAQANCLAEMVACSVTDSSSGNISFAWYDPYGRNIFNFTWSGIWAVSWIGRFGEKNLVLEIYKPGRYYCVASYPGGSTTKYFDVYEQTTNKYVHKQGDDTGAVGNSWGAALATMGAGKTALSSGNILYVGEGDYSSETGFAFNKSMTITPVKATWGGYPNITDSNDTYVGDGASYTAFCVSNPIEMDGTIDRWAHYYAYDWDENVKLKIYRGGNPGTNNRTTSTLVASGDSHFVNHVGGARWVTFSETPITVQRGDILAIYSDDAFNIGLKAVTAYSSGLASCCTIAGDTGNVTIGDTTYNGYDLMLRAWNSGTNFTVKLPKTS